MRCFVIWITHGHFVRAIGEESFVARCKRFRVDAQFPHNVGRHIDDNIREHHGEIFEHVCIDHLIDRSRLGIRVMVEAILRPSDIDFEAESISPIACDKHQQLRNTHDPDAHCLRNHCKQIDRTLGNTFSYSPHLDTNDIVVARFVKSVASLACIVVRGSWISQNLHCNRR